MSKLSQIPASCFKNVSFDESAINETVRKYVEKASILKIEEKTALLINAIRCIDLTSLTGNETESNISALCEKAMQPVVPSSRQLEDLHTAAVCVYPEKATIAIEALKKLRNIHHPDSNDVVRVACVAAGFPSGKLPLEARLNEIEKVANLGVDEVDVVIDRSLVVRDKWQDLYNEMKAMRTACKKACMKTILSVGELRNLNDVYTASMMAMHAGTNFIKTSTGKEAVNATLPVGIVMCQAIKDFHKETDIKIGFKPAGGIKTAEEALQWMILMKEELGDSWLNKEFFRFGASSLLDDIVRSII